MRKPIRVLKRCSRDVIIRYEKDKKGIKRHGKGWLVRLLFVDGVPTFSQYIPDSKFGCRFKSLEQAFIIRDAERINLKNRGLCKKKRDSIDENGKLRNLSLSKRKTKNGYSLSWVAHYYTNGELTRKKFSFWKNKKVINAFIMAVMSIRKHEIKLHGSSEIQVDMKSIHGYLNAYLKTMDKSQSKYRILRRFL